MTKSEHQAALAFIILEVVCSDTFKIKFKDGKTVLKFPASEGALALAKAGGLPFSYKSEGYSTVTKSIEADNKVITITLETEPE